MIDCLAVSMSASSILRRPPQIVYRPLIILPLRKVDGQLCDNLSYPAAVLCFFLFPNPLMQAASPCCAQSLVQQILIQRVTEAVACRPSPLWLDALPIRLHK